MPGGPNICGLLFKGLGSGVMGPKWISNFGTPENPTTWVKSIVLRQTMEVTVLNDVNVI